MYKLQIQKVPSRLDLITSVKKYKAFISKAFLWISGNSHGILKSYKYVCKCFFQMLSFNENTQI